MQDKQLDYLKTGIWIYIYLLIFEGALRKWFLPGLATPLLVVRDPVAFLLLFYGIFWGKWRPNTYVMLGILLTLIGLVFTLLTGHGNLFVGLYGARIMLLHFPLIFLIGKVFTYQDVTNIGRHLLVIGIGMTVLMALQFYSPQSAWVNRGVAGDMSGSGFSGAGGFYRVPGTFSFTNGLVSFYALVLPFILYFLIGKGLKVNKNMLYLCAVAYLVAIPMSISRTMFFQTFVSILFLVVFSVNNPKVIIRVLLGVGLVFLLLIFGRSIDAVDQAAFAFESRFEAANRNEGGMVEGVLIDRFLGGMLKVFNTDRVNWLGQGLGMGSNAGARLLNAEGKFLISEGEWGRIVGERGMLGFLIVLLRVVLVASLFLKSWVAVQKKHVLPWLLLSGGVVIILQGQWSQPTALGFAVVSGGFILASLKKNNSY